MLGENSTLFSKLGIIPDSNAKQAVTVVEEEDVDVTGQLHLAYVAFAAGTTHLKIQIGNTPAN